MAVYFLGFGFGLALLGHGPNCRFRLLDYDFDGFSGFGFGAGFSSLARRVLVIEFALFDLFCGFGCRVQLWNIPLCDTGFECPCSRSLIFQSIIHLFKVLFYLDTPGFALFYGSN